MGKFIPYTYSQRGKEWSLVFVLAVAYEALFNIHDKDKDGNISMEELGNALRDLDYTPTAADLLSLMEEVDLEEDDDIDFDDFLTLMIKQSSKPDTDFSEEQLMEAFFTFDEDGDGYITPAELRRAMANLGENLTDEIIDEMIKDADTDGDGRISFPEFAKMALNW